MGVILRGNEGGLKWGGGSLGTMITVKNVLIAVILSPNVRPSEAEIWQYWECV